MRIVFSAHIDSTEFARPHGANVEPSDGAAVARLFEAVADDLRARDIIAAHDGGSVRDRDGNAVGSWKVVHG